MAADTSPQETVSRLKELLFESESRELDTLNRRLADVQLRAGSEEQFQKAVARVLDAALREAESSRHRELSDAMAPMVLRTLRAEMKSPEMQDQIAGAMYPRMGEMVSRYVSSAIRDLMQEINRRLESGLTHNRFFLWMRSVASGRSMAELALAATQRLEVREIYLVRRGSGALVHHWRRPGDAGEVDGANRDSLVSGFLAAFTALAEEAFEADKESLRTLDLDDHRIYLRGSPDYLLAAKCIGSATAGVDRDLDAELIRVLAEHQEIERSAPSAAGVARPPEVVSRLDTLLGGFSERIEQAASERTEQASRSHGARTLRIISWAIALPLIGFTAWYLYISFITSALQTKADAVITAIPALKGYPVRAHVERGGQRIWVAGLAPDEATRRKVLGDLKQVAPRAELSEAVGVLPKPDVQARLDAEAFRRAVDRSRRKLMALAADLSGVRGRMSGAADAALSVAGNGVAAALLELQRPRVGVEGDRADEALRKTYDNLVAAAGDLAAVVGSDASAPSRPPTDATEAVEALSLVADRISSLVAVVEQRRAVAPIAKRLDAVGETVEARAAEVDRLAGERIAALDQRYRDRIAELERRIESLRPAPATPRQRLEAVIRSKAIFFSVDSDYRDPAAAAKVLDELADIIRQDPRAVIRVVGYTDDAGTTARNSSLSQGRADRVVADLVARGIPAGRLIAVGRLNGNVLAPGSGVDSPNRRVEFEIAFGDEKGGLR
ncbi:MAG: OmpA family protein [Hyphomicrobiaceae bacterium]